MEKPCKVFADNKEQAVEKARVSKYPINRHWPGHQRGLEQTEICGFVSFDMENTPKEVKIVCDFDFKEVTVKPLSLNIKPKTENNTVTFDINKPCQAVVEFDNTFGALHIFANPKEVITNSDYETITFKKGIHNVGRIELKSNQKIYLEEGAVVYGEIYGKDVCNVEISGRGILDQSKQNVFTVSDDFIDPLRPSPIEIRYSKNVVIKDIIVRDPFFLAVRPIGCEDLLIDNIKIIGCWRYNSDGIDLINCKNGLIKNCFVRSFDDSICLKGFCYPYIDEMTYNGKVFDIMENITVSNCVVWNEWGKALEIGVDICANEVRNCKFENCDVIHASYSVMDISNVDYADIHNITFQNIRVECEKGELLPVMQTEENEIYDISCERSYPKLSTVLIYYTDEYSSKGDKRGKVHDVLFKDIYIYADKMLESTIHGFSKEYCVNNIVYENISFNGMQISDKDDLRLETGEFAQNIVFK